MFLLEIFQVKPVISIFATIYTIIQENRGAQNSFSFHSVACV